MKNDFRIIVLIEIKKNKEISDISAVQNRSNTGNDITVLVKENEKDNVARAGDEGFETPAT